MSVMQALLPDMCRADGAAGRRSLLEAVDAPTSRHELERFVRLLEHSLYLSETENEYFDIELDSAYTWVVDACADARLEAVATQDRTAISRLLSLKLYSISSLV